MRSGFCNASNLTESHERCTLSGCACECHTDPSPALVAGTPEGARHEAGTETFGQPSAMRADDRAGEGIQSGIYSADELSNSDYHGERDYLSSTALKRALPSYTDPDNEDALTFGSLVHTVVLEPHRLPLDYVTLDAAKIAGADPKTGRPYINPTMTGRYKAAVAEAQQTGLTVVDQADWDKAHRMADSVHAHREAAQLLHAGTGAYEESVFWRDDAGVGHKARFDRRIPGAIVDLKSTTTALTDDELAKAADAFMYPLSAVHYLAGAAAAGLDADTFVLVFVSKKSPHHVRVVDLDEAFLAIGRDLRAKALDLTLNGQHGWSTLTPPRWSRHDLGASA